MLAPFGFESGRPPGDSEDPPVQVPEFRRLPFRGEACHFGSANGDAAQPPLEVVTDSSDSEVHHVTMLRHSKNCKTLLLLSRRFTLSS